MGIIATLVGLKTTLAEGRWRVGDDACGVRFTFADKTHAIYTVPATAQTPADWTEWIATGDVLTAPLANAFVAALGMPGFGTDGVAFTSTLGVGSGGVTKADDTILMRAGAPGLDLLAREGGTAPDADGIPLLPNIAFKSFGDPISGASGRVAFLATLTGVPTAQSTGLWFATPDGTLRLLARTGDQAPSGGRWGAFQSVVLPDGNANGPVVLATLLVDAADGISSRNNLGLWATDVAGTLQLLLRTGDKLVVGNGVKEVVSFTALALAPSSIGAAHGYSDTAVSALARFSDGTTGLLTCTLP